MSDTVARSEIARIIIDLFGAWNTEPYDQNRVNDLISDACVQVLRDPNSMMAEAEFKKIMSALYYSYNLLSNISSRIPDEDLEGYGSWCSQIEGWIEKNVGLNSVISDGAE